MKFKFGVQNLSYCRPGCHRSPKPSGERTIQRPPESPNAWPHAFSQGLMNVETPAPPGLVAPGRPRADSVPPLSRCRLVLRSARANSTPVDSCRFVPSRTRPRSHAAPLARGPAQTRARPREGAAAVGGPAVQKIFSRPRTPVSTQQEKTHPKLRVEAIEP